MEEFKYTVKTQAVAELTNYRGINDWGEVRCILLIIICLTPLSDDASLCEQLCEEFGRTFHRGCRFSIFNNIYVSMSFLHRLLELKCVSSKTDKSVGLMSITFPLFTVGFLIPGFVYIGTCWAANVPKGLTFASQRFWTAAMV